MGLTTSFSGASLPVLITGGTRGIGFAIASAFADAGAAVTITGTRASVEDYDNAAALSRFTYRRCRLDNADEIDDLAASFDELAVLVNNAGLSLPDGKDEYDPDVFARSLQLNLVGPYRLTAACKRSLSAWAANHSAASASVVNIASMASLFGIEMVPGYSSAKSGLLGMTRTLAASWARNKIRVNAVAPGLIETDMTEPMLGFPAMVDPMLDRTPMRRVGVGAEVAPAVLFLCSDSAAFITGAVLPVDGGYSAKG